jgi:hypothetical protein
MPIISPISATPTQMGFRGTGGTGSYNPAPMNYTGSGFPMGGQSKSVSSFDRPSWNSRTQETEKPFTRNDALLERYGGSVAPPPINPMDSWDSMNRDEPDAVLDPTDITTKIIIQKMYESDRWMMKLFPLRKTNKLTVEYTRWVFNETGMTRVPHESVGRYSSNYKTHYREALIRIGHQIKMEMNHMALPEGALEFTYKLWQIAFAIEEGTCHDIIVACLDADHYDPQDNEINRVWRKADLGGDGSLLSKFRPEFTAFACINKGGGFANLRTVAYRTSEEFANNNQGTKPNVFIFPYGTAAYWAESAERNNNYLETGHVSPLLGTPRSDSLTLPNGVRYYESRSFRLGQYVTEDDPMCRQRSCGSYFFMNDEHMRGVPLEEQRTMMYDLKVQDESRDKMVFWKYAERFHELGVYNNWQPGLDMTTLKKNHPSLSLPGMKFMGMEDPDGGVSSYLEMYQKKCGASYANDLVNAIAMKPDLISRIMAMSLIPFRFSAGNSEHLDERRPLFALHRDGQVQLSGNLFTGAEGDGSGYWARLKKSLSSLTNDQSSNRVVSSRGSRGDNEDAGYRKSKRTSGMVADDQDDDAYEARIQSVHNSYASTDEDTDREDSYSSRKSGREDEDDDIQMDNSVDLLTQVKTIISTTTSNQQHVTGSLYEFLGALIIADDETKHAYEYLRQGKDLLQKNPDDEVPGYTAWKLIEPSMVYNEVNECGQELAQVGSLTALERFINDEHEGNFYISRDESSVNRRANDINTEQCYTIQVPGLNTAHTLELIAEPSMSVRATLSQSSAYATLAARRLVLAYIPEEVMEAYKKNPAENAFSLYMGSNLKSTDDSMAQGDARLCALHYNAVLSYLARLFKSFPYRDGVPGLLDETANTVRNICSISRFNHISLDAYHTQMSIIQAQFKVATFQVALEPFIKELVALTKIFASGDVANDSDALQSALMRCTAAAVDHARFLADHGVDMNTMTKTLNPSTGAGPGQSFSLYRRGGGGPSGSGSPQVDVAWKDKILEYFRSDKQIYMSHAETSSNEDDDDDVEDGGIDMKFENEHVSMVHARNGAAALDLLLEGLKNVYASLPDKVGTYTKWTAFVVIARLAHMTLLRRDYKTDDYNPAHRAMYILNYFYHKGRNVTESDIKDASQWLDNLLKLDQSTNNALYRTVVSQIFEKRNTLDLARFLASIPVDPTEVKINSTRLDQIKDRASASRRGAPGAGATNNLVEYYLLGDRPGSAITGGDLDRIQSLLSLNGFTLKDRFASYSGSAFLSVKDVALVYASTYMKKSPATRSRAEDLSATEMRGNRTWGIPRFTNDPINMDDPTWNTYLSYLHSVDSAEFDPAGFRKAADRYIAGGSSTDSMDSTLRKSSRSIESGLAQSIAQSDGAASTSSVFTEDEIRAYPLSIRKKVIRAFLDYFPVEDGRLLYLLIEHDVKPPIGYVCYRPFRTYLMGCMLAIYSTDEDPVGVTAYHPFRMTLGEDSQTQVIMGQVTGWTRPIALDKQRIYKVHDVFCKRYLNGNDLSTIQWYKTNYIYGQLNAIGKYGGSVIATPRWINFECVSQPMDLTGAFASWVPANSVEKKLCSYSLAKHICETLKISHSKFNGTPWEDSFHMSNQRHTEDNINTICFQGCQMRYSHVTKGFDDVIVENGHWGEEVGDGCCANVREGFPGKVKEYNYSKTAMIITRG